MRADVIKGGFFPLQFQIEQYIELTFFKIIIDSHAAVKNNPERAPLYTLLSFPS